MLHPLAWGLRGAVRTQGLIGGFRAPWIKEKRSQPSPLGFRGFRVYGEGFGVWGLGFRVPLQDQKNEPPQMSPLLDGGN